MSTPRDARSDNNLARYLYSLRISHGFESVADYLRERKLPISEAYYRALEAGKKSGKEVSIATAGRLCEALQADPIQFFTHLLKDLLPDDVFTAIVRPVKLESFGSVSERQALLQRDLALYQSALATMRLEESFVPPASAIELLLANPDWLPIIHLVYMHDSVPIGSLAKLHKLAGIGAPLDEVLFKLHDHGVLNFTKDLDSTPSVSRKGPIFRVPPSAEGRVLKDLFAQMEMEKSLPLPRGDAPFSGETTFIEARIEAYPTPALHRLRGRVLDLLVEATASASQDPAGNSYFVALVISPRPEYSAVD